MGKSGLAAPSIESGVIANVNVQNLTVDWVSQYTSKHIPDLQIMTPYVHYNNGEGFTCVPEVGAICSVCFPSDEESPFVLGFLTGPELQGAESADLKAAIEDPNVETEEDVPAAISTQSTGSTVTPTNPSDASFRGGRPILNPGDMLWQGRDENFVVLRRGGVLQIGATNICQRAYIPVLNYIRDFCENWEMNTAAGTLAWTVQRKENDPAGNAPTEFSLVTREFSQDKKASVKLLIGSLDDATKPPKDAAGGTGDKSFIELTIAPQKISPDDGKVEGEPKFVIRLDKAGNTFVMQAGARTEEIKGDHKLTVSGKQDITVKGEYKALYEKTHDTSIKGEHTVAGEKSSKEIWKVNKVIGAKVVKIGSEGASEPAALGLKLITWLASHTHPPLGPPVQAPGLAKVISKKVFVE